MNAVHLYTHTKKKTTRNKKSHYVSLCAGSSQELVHQSLMILEGTTFGRFSEQSR